ncbi:hypothetical protein Tco_0696025 [Tanacetum coccineum]
MMSLHMLVEYEHVVLALTLHRETATTVEFRRISLTGFHSCTSRSHYRSVSKQTTRHDQASKRSKSSCDGCWIAKSWITCGNTNGNTTLSEALGVSMRITSDMRVRLRVADSHTGNHPEDDFTPLKTIRRPYSVIRKKIPFELEWETFEPERGDSIATKTCELSKEEFNDFLTLYPIPFEYRVILPKSNQTTFDAPLGYVHISRLNPFGCAKLTTFVVMCKAYGCEPSVDLFYVFFILCRAGKWLTFAKRSEKHVPNLLPEVITRIEEMAFRNFIYTEDDEDLSFLPKEPSLGLITGSLYVLVNTKPLKVTADSGESLKPELFFVRPRSVAVRIKDMKCTTRGGSSSPPVKRKLAPGSLTSRATRAKTFSSKEDVPFLTVSDDDEGLPDVLELKDATICHLKIFAITPPAWKNHLDNHIYLELLDLHDRCYARHRRSRELLQVIEKLRGEFHKNPAEVAFWEKIYALSTEVKEHKLYLDMMMLESQKWAGYQQSLLTLESKDRREVVSKVVPYAAIELVHNDDICSLVGKLVFFAIVYGRCRAFDQASNDLATTTFPWLDKFVADPLAPIKALLSKKPPTLQTPAPSRTQVPLPSFQRATPSFVLVSNPMSPPADASVMKPQCSQLH